MGMHWIDNCSGIEGGGWMIFGMFLFWTLLLLIGFYLIRSFSKGSASTHEDHMNILKVRLAKGEISEQEYERLKSKLTE